jgi:cytochrome c1
MIMDSPVDELLISAARRLKGSERREFLAEVCCTLCEGNPRKAEQRFGWGRQTVAKGMSERHGGIKAPKTPERRGRRRSEEQNPQLAIDIRLIVEPQTLKPGIPMPATRLTDTELEDLLDYLEGLE